MSYNPQNPNGQATAANSTPVVIASDQSVVSANNAQVAGTATSVGNGATDAGTQRVTIASDSTGQVIARGNAASGAADSGNPVKVGGVYNSAAPTFTTGQRGDLQLDASGNLKVAANGLALDTSVTGLQVAQSSTTASQLGPLVQAAVTTNAPTYTNGQTSPLNMNTLGGLRVAINTGSNAIGTVNLSPTTSGGWSVSSQTALTTTATVSGAAGKFGGYMFVNTNSSAAYVQVFDTTGAVTLGTTVPTFVVPIPAGAGANIEFANGIAITNGIKVAATTTATGSTTVATALTGFILYK